MRSSYLCKNNQAIRTAMILVIIFSCMLIVSCSKKEASGQVSIKVDGKAYEIPENAVYTSIDQSFSLAWKLNGAAAGTGYYDVFRSTDVEKKQWERIAQDVLVSGGDVAYMEEIQDGLLCHFHIGTGGWHLNLISKDRGMTWENYDPKDTQTKDPTTVPEQRPVKQDKVVLTGEPELTDGAMDSGANTGNNESVNETVIEPVNSEKKYIVVLDPGHGGFDPGAVHYGRQEKDLNLKIALYAKKYLEDNYDFISVYMTREEDIALGKTKAEDLTRRVQIAVELEADILVSFHMNAYDKTETGAVVYCPHRESVKETSFSLGDSILKELENLGIKNRGSRIWKSSSAVDDEGNAVEALLINRYSADAGLAGIIVEHCFMDSREDEVFIDSESDLQLIGEADAKGIAGFLEK